MTGLPGRQGEQGRGRRHVPGLRPPDHVGSQPPVRIPVRGIHPGPGIVPDPQIPWRHGHPGDLVVGRGAVAAAVDGDYAAYCDQPSAAIMCRAALCGMTYFLLHRSRPMVIRIAKTVLSARLGEQSLASGLGACRDTYHLSVR